jgi:hypothetical protein
MTRPAQGPEKGGVMVAETKPYATLKIELDGDTTFNDADDIEERLRTLADVDRDGKVMKVRWDAQTEWDLRGLVWETLVELESHFGDDVFDAQKLIDDVKVYRPTAPGVDNPALDITPWPEASYVG